VDLEAFLYTEEKADDTAIMAPVSATSRYTSLMVTYVDDSKLVDRYEFEDQGSTVGKIVTDI
jgi:hypothetical protein